MTKHYSIPQYGPAGTADPMAVYSVYNPAMKVIDDILWAFKERMDGLEARIAKAEQDIVNLDDRLTEEVDKINQTIHDEVSNINQTIQEMGDTYDVTISDILAKFYGGGTVDDDGHVKWGDVGKAATGNINVFGNSSLSSYIRTVDGTGTNSVRVN